MNDSDTLEVRADLCWWCLSPRMQNYLRQALGEGIGPMVILGVLNKAASAGVIHVPYHELNLAGRFLFRLRRFRQSRKKK